MKRLLIIIAVCALEVSAMAGNSKVGSAGAQFLKIGVGSRYQAMGEASVAMTDDVYSMYWNPAGLASIENTSVAFTNVNWVLDIDLNYFGLARNFDGIGVFGVSASMLSMGDQEITTFDEQEGTGDMYSASSYAVGITYARMLTARFAFGGTVKFIGERIHLERAQGFAFDFGTLLQTGFRSLRLGMSISNMGAEMKFDGPSLGIRYEEGSGTGNTVPVEMKVTPYDLPMMFRVGAAYDVDFSPNSRLTFATEMRHPNDNIEQGSIGAEFAYSEKYFLRGGYKIQYEEEGLTLGGGLSAPISGDTKLSVDYSWQDFGRLQSTQRFSVGFTF